MKYTSNLIDYLNEFKNDFSFSKGNLVIIDSNDDFTTNQRFVRGNSFCLLFESPDYEIPLIWFNLKYPTKADFDRKQGKLVEWMRAPIPDDKDVYKEFKEYFAFDIEDVLEAIKDFRQKQLVQLIQR